VIYLIKEDFFADTGGIPLLLGGLLVAQLPSPALTGEIP